MITVEKLDAGLFGVNLISLRPPRRSVHRDRPTPVGGEKTIRVRRGTTGGSKAVRRGVEGPARDRAGVGWVVWLGCCGLVHLTIGI